MKLVVLVPFLCVFTHTCARSVDVDLVEVDQTTREIVSTKIGCILEVNPNCPTKAVTCTIPRSVMRWSREELTTHLKSLMTVRYRKKVSYKLFFSLTNSAHPISKSASFTWIANGVAKNV